MVRLILPVALCPFLLDQATKWLVVHWLNLIETRFMVIWEGYIYFIMAWNEGVNFGLFSDSSDQTRFILIGIALVICALVIYWTRTETNTIALISAGLLLGGAMGNVVDRVLYGAVADFLNVTCCGIRNPFSFNVADITIFIGAFGLIIFATDKKTA